ncbi:MAG: nitrite reductase small subunit NirD [Acaryochloridaceae cyanobacterium RU_4_10]|nr:nitrite reductase small subunit NirD [Acaryochloridaceae cyanobacterium RU_4_10]
MPKTQSIQQSATQWTTVCPIDRIALNTGVCALVNETQIAIFRVGDGNQIYAISNYDPFSKAHVLSRGIVGDRNGIPKVASPVYKQNFNLITGECLDDPNVKVATFLAQVVDEQVQIKTGATTT